MVNNNTSVCFVLKACHEPTNALTWLQTQWILNVWRHRQTPLWRCHLVAPNYCEGSSRTLFLVAERWFQFEPLVSNVVHPVCSHGCLPPHTPAATPEINSPVFLQSSTSSEFIPQVFFLSLFWALFSLLALHRRCFWWLLCWPCWLLN